MGVPVVVVLGALAGAADHSQRSQHAEEGGYHHRVHHRLPHTGDDPERPWHGHRYRRRSAVLLDQAVLLEEVRTRHRAGSILWPSTWVEDSHSSQLWACLIFVYLYLGSALHAPVTESTRQHEL